VELYTPIPELAVRRAPRPLRIAGALLLALALALVVVPAVRYTFNIGMPPDFHYYGTVETRFGTAGVYCGGESAAPCGESTMLQLPTCEYQVRTRLTFHSGTREVSVVSTRSTVSAPELVQKRPPSGDHWSFGCGNPAMIRGTAAHLEPNE
jgi:hypothetical protein